MNFSKGRLLLTDLINFIVVAHKHSKKTYNEIESCQLSSEVIFSLFYYFTNYSRLRNFLLKEHSRSFYCYNLRPISTIV